MAVQVSIVTVSFNSKEFLRDCLESVFKFTSEIDFEFIVVDNASTDGTAQWLADVKSGKEKIPGVDLGKVKFVFSKENGGFSKGNNWGIKEAIGEYILLLNPDTKFLENSLKVMKTWMDGHQDCAVASCQLLDIEQKVLPTGGYAPILPRVAAWALFLDDLPILSKIFKSYHPHAVGVPWTEFLGDIPGIKFFLKPGAKLPEKAPVYHYDHEFFPDWVTGAFFFARKKAFDQLGALDEEIFMYGEELEWCLRAAKSGWKVGYTPQTRIVHLERKSSGGAPRNALLGEFKGLKYIYGKYEPVWKQLILGTILDVGAVLRIIFWMVRLKPAVAKIYFEALML